MSIDEQARHELHAAAGRALGSGEAATLMALLPPVGWADVATKNDLDAQREILTAEIRGVRTELTAEIGRVRTELTAEIGRVRTELTAEIGRVRTELTAEIGRVRSELGGEIGGLEGRLNASLEARMADNTRTILLAVIGLIVATWAAIAALGLAR